VERLRALLSERADEALEDVREWGSYASGYFADKWDLAACIAKWERRRDRNTPVAALRPAPDTTWVETEEIRKDYSRVKPS
jgi:hypothetical protein